MTTTRRLVVAGATAAAVLAVHGLAPAGATPKDSRLEPGATFQECRTCPEMVVIPAGKFVMGTPEGQRDHEKDEHQHEVTIANAFGLGVSWYARRTTSVG
jgi:formylglycine-generating enzyme required for sulfatase activity